MAKQKSPAFQRYPKDYLGDELVMRMTLEEEGAYNRLMDFAWLEGSIPADMRGLAALCKNVSLKKMTAIWETIGCKFAAHPDLPGRLIHKRLERERDKQKVWSEKSREGGKRSAEKRWGTKDEPQTPEPRTAQPIGIAQIVGKIQPGSNGTNG